MAPPSIIPNFTTEADQPVANKPIAIPNPIAELSNQSLNAA